jgi:hypothetical protein
MTLVLAERISLFIADFLFFGSATIGFKWVTSPYQFGYITAGLGFLTLAIFIRTFAKS